MNLNKNRRNYSAGFAPILSVLVVIVLLAGFVWVTIKYQSYGPYGLKNQAAVSSAMVAASSSTAVDSALPDCKSDIQIKALTIAYNNAVKSASSAQMKADQSAANKAFVAAAATANKQFLVTHPAQLAAEKASTTYATKLAAQNKISAQIASTTNPTTLASLKKSLVAAHGATGLAWKDLSAKISVFEVADAKLKDLESVKQAKADAYTRFSDGTELKNRTAELDRSKKTLDTFKTKPLCPKIEVVAQCLDTIDNDRDGKADCYDTDCSGLQVCKDWLVQQGNGSTITIGTDGNTGSGTGTGNGAGNTGGTGNGGGSDTSPGNTGGGNQDICITEGADGPLTPEQYCSTPGCQNNAECQVGPSSDTPSDMSEECTIQETADGSSGWSVSGGIVGMSKGPCDTSGQCNASAGWKQEGQPKRVQIGSNVQMAYTCWKFVEQVSICKEGSRYTSKRETVKRYQTCYQTGLDGSGTK